MPTVGMSSRATNISDMYSRTSVIDATTLFMQHAIPTDVRTANMLHLEVEAWLWHKAIQVWWNTSRHNDNADANERILPNRGLVLGGLEWQSTVCTINHNTLIRVQLPEYTSSFEPLCYSRGMSPVWLCDAIKAWLEFPPYGCYWTCLPLAGQKTCSCNINTHIALWCKNGYATAIQGLQRDSNTTHSMYRLLIAMKLIIDEKGPHCK